MIGVRPPVRRRRGSIVAAMLAATILASCGSDDAPLEWLFVQTAEEARLTPTATLELRSTERIFGFTDRPDRLHTLLTPAEFVALWDPSIGGGFASDPPNAVLTWRDGDGTGLVEIVIIGATIVEPEGIIGYRIAASVGDLPIGELTEVDLFVDGTPLPSSCSSVLDEGPGGCAAIPGGFFGPGPNGHWQMGDMARLGG